MNKKHFSFALVLVVLIATSAVFAQDGCNYYVSSTGDSAKVEAWITSVSEKTATINVKSFVGTESIEVYKVVVGDETFTYRDIGGNTTLAPKGSTTIKVTSKKSNGHAFGQRNPSVTVYLKTCE